VGTETAARPDASASREAPRSPPLDGVRGLAILFVMLFHFTALVGPPQRFLDECVLKVTAAGWCGVDLFFVLSGFLITGILLDAKPGATRYFRNFYARRTLRIFPAYYMFLLLMAVVVPLVLSNERDAMAYFRERLVWYATYTTNIHQDGNPIFRGDFYFASHLWSLAAEEQFYLVWPAVVLLLPRRSLMGMCGVVIVAALLVRVALDVADVDHYVGHEITPARMDTLAVGALISLAARDAHDVALLRRVAPPVSLAAAAALIIIFFTRYRFSPFDTAVQTAGYTAIAFAFGGIVVLAMSVRPGSAADAVLSFRWLRFLGKYSYALYLFHWPVASMIAHRTDALDGVPLVAGSILLREAVFITLAGSISIAVAWVSWQVWEGQWLKLKSRFPYRRGGLSI
jgi:peptidoglycan/LPS O-acetylase OafA/YrhL